MCEFMISSSSSASKAACKRGEERKKETLFKCQVYLALRHTNWGHCKLKLIQIKFNEMQVFEERGKPLRAEKRTYKLNPHMTPSLETRTLATFLGGECSHHCTTTALHGKPIEFMFVDIYMSWA